MHPTADGDRIAGLLAVVTGVVWLLLEVRQSTNHRPEARTADGGSRPVIRVATVVGAVGAITAARHTSAEIPPAGAWVGLVLLWCGVGLRFWSFRTLGRFFTFTVQTSSDQPVISDGPYRLVRHPSYAGILVAVTGVGLLIGNWWSLLVLTVAVTCGLVYRIRVEERALLGDLGDGYRQYAATHKRLVPFIW